MSGAFLEKKQKQKTWRFVIIIVQNSDVLHFNRRAFLTHSLPSDQGGDMRCEVWHQQEWTVTPKSTARRRTLPPNSFVNRLSQYGLICVQLLSLLSTRQHTEDSVWLDVWPLTALSVRLLGKCIKHRGETIFQCFHFFFFGLPSACHGETDVPLVWANETKYDNNGVQIQSL